MQQLLDLDGGILLAIQEYVRTPALTPFFQFITHLGDRGMIWIVLTVLMLLFAKTRKAGAASAVALIGSLVINNGILKNLVARARPYDVLEGLVPLLERQKDFSFPSGHTAASFAAAFVILRMLPRKYGIPAVILAVLISFSRLYLGVHYPTDVLAGMISGILISFAAERVIKAISGIR